VLGIVPLELTMVRPSPPRAGTEAQPQMSQRVEEFQQVRPVIFAFRALRTGRMRSNTQEILQQIKSRASQHRLRMELHAFHSKLAVPKTHNRPVFRLGGNFQLAR